MRTRFTEYAIRFVRLASRYEEETLGSTSIGYPSTPFSELPDRPPQLGSGIIFNDEAAGMKELMNNASRIDGWRKTNSYQYCVRVSLVLPWKSRFPTDLDLLFVFRILRRLNPKISSRVSMSFINYFASSMLKTCLTAKFLL